MVRVVDAGAGPAVVATAGAGPDEGTVLVWGLPDDDFTVGDLEANLLAGMATAARVVGEEPARLVNLVVPGGPPPLAAALASTVAGWGRGLARELARHQGTVNTVIGGPTPATWALVSWLAGPEAGFVTGQTLGNDPGPPAAHPTGGAGGGGDRVALVSGGAGDLGQAIVARLVADGWQVVIGHRPGTDAAAVARAIDPTAAVTSTLPLDLLDVVSIEEAAATLVARHRRLDGLVLNAGWTPTGPFSTMAKADRERVVSTNLTGPARLLVALESVLEARTTVVGTGSEAGRAGESGRAIYSGAKAGLAGLLAALDGRPARCLTVAPGPFDTTLLRQTWGEPERAERGIDRLRQLVPLRRLGEPAELGAAVAFALSPAGAALAGQTLSVGGGITMV